MMLLHHKERYYRKPRKKELKLSGELHIIFEGNLKSETTVVFLHGIASSHDNWKRIIEKVDDKFKIVTVDLLGFGDSPTPLWSNYTVETHAKSVIRSLKLAGVDGPFILVGHSMGCIISSHIATLFSEMVSALYLVSPPIYKGWELHARTLGRSERFMHRAYFSLYDYFCEDVLFTTFIGGLLTKLVGKPTSFQLRMKHFIAFRRSLRNCIEFQHVEDELKKTKIDHINAYYGAFDMLIIKRYVERLPFINKRVNVQKIPKTGHVVSSRMALAVAHDLLRREGNHW